MTSLSSLRPRRSIVIALELLGLDELEQSGERARAVIAGVVQHLGEPEKANHQEWRLVLTGRRALRIAPIKPAGTVLFWELLDILHLQAQLVPFGVLLRGAITLGDVSANASVSVGRSLTASRAEAVVGPGITEAERLRDTVAEVPRVLVDARLIREAEQNADLRLPHHTVLQELGYVRELLQRDSDGLWFVDYLKAFESEVDEPSVYVDVLAEHAELVKRGIASCTELDHQARRWTWLWRYHNRVIEACFRHGRIGAAERAALRVPAHPPLLYTFAPSAKAPE
ncbi:hypothetical protein BE17_13150 [Sorangium cellulosum]|uniref:Uncharacterized protein n=1 Tax=Sorangium cellulosum TaxID=56 RepID=A0A150RE89_SORCE|nr:hypothetical protein BE17_13150 [Sorangium cellulosum]